jgi:hypothetical protein
MSTNYAGITNLIPIWKFTSMLPPGNECEACHDIWSTHPYPIESGVAPEGGGEGGGEVHQVLLKPVLGYDLPVIRPNGLMGLVLAP